MKEQNLNMQSKGMEKKSEENLEKNSIEDERCRTFGEIIIVIEGITGILLPVIVGLVTGREEVNVHLCVVLSAVAIIADAISLIVLEQKKGLDGE